jgi:uncharacterized protein (TIGR00369 family)
MAERRLTLEEMQKLIGRGPFHQWLGLKVTEVTDDAVTILCPWRDELVVNPDRGYAHGGILATLVDIGGDYAIAAATGRAWPTVDMRVDYHRAAMGGDLTVTGRVIKLGSTFTTAEANVHDKSGSLCASGRGVYFTAPPPPPKS